MPSILSIIADLDYRGSARQATQLAIGLTGERSTVRVFSLRGPGPFAVVLRRHQIPALGRRPRGPLSLENFLALRRLMKADPPDVIHAWGLDALRALAWVRVGRRAAFPPVVVSLDGSDLARPKSRRLSRTLLDWPRRFIVRHPFERERFGQLGLPFEKIAVIPPGIAAPTTVPVSLRAEHGVAPSDCLFIAVGHFRSSSRFEDTLWSLDLVHGIDLAARLMVIGDGPSRGRIVSRSYFGKHPEGGMMFLGSRPDAADLLTQADAVIVGHRRQGGTYAVLEGMAAGKAVLAADLPHLRPFIRDGETGLLAEPGNIPAFSRLALRLVRDPRWRSELGVAARDDALARFPLSRMLAAHADCYATLAGR